MIELAPSAVTTWGGAIVFVNVLLTRLGVPIPAVPVLLFAGSAIAGGTLSFWPVLLAAVLGALIGDGVWFTLGRVYGRRLIAALARFAPLIHSKLGRARSLFERFGVPLVSISKFVPGLALITPPLMGTTPVDARIYAAWDLASAVVWASFWLLGGAAADRQLHMLLGLVKAQGATVIDVLVLVALGYLAFRLIQRRRERKRARAEAALATPAPRAGKHPAVSPVVLDVRPRAAHDVATQRIPGAVTLDPDSPGQLDGALLACERVIYCICADRAAALDITERMRRIGFTRIRALQGGLGAWQRRGFPIEPFVGPENGMPAATIAALGARLSASPQDDADNRAVTLRGLAPRRTQRG